MSKAPVFVPFSPLRRRRGGGGTFVISLVVHLAVLAGATIIVVSRPPPKKSEEFKSAPIRLPPLEVTRYGPIAASVARRQEGAASTPPRIVAEGVSTSIQLPDVIDAPADFDILRDLGGGGLSGLGVAETSATAPTPSAASAGAESSAPFGSRTLANPKTGALEGSFYDLKLDRRRDPYMAVEKIAKLDPAALATVGSSVAVGEYTAGELSKFFKRGWAKSFLEDYFPAPAPLYATQIFIPNLPSNRAPADFGVSDVVKPRGWVVRYTARIRPPADGWYRFVGKADDFLYVRLAGKMVLDASFNRANAETVVAEKLTPSEKVELPENFHLGRRMFLKANQDNDLDVLIGEGPGGTFSAYLLYCREGDTYPRNASGESILPVVRFAEVPLRIPEGFPASTSGPLWRSAVPVQAPAAAGK